MDITIVSGNLLAGGIGRHRSEMRYWKSLNAIVEADADIFAGQELLYWDEDGGARVHEAEHVTGMRVVMTISPKTRMHTAVFVGPRLRIVSNTGYADAPWHHSATKAVVAWDGPDGFEAGQMTVGSAHFHPRSPQARIREAEEFYAWFDAYVPDGTGRLTVAGLDNTPDAFTDLVGTPAHIQVREALHGTTEPDTRPVDHLISAGFIDLATRTGTRRPPRTTGHWKDKERPGRPDRIIASPVAAKLMGEVEVIEAVKGLTDHLWPRTRMHLPTG